MHNGLIAGGVVAMALATGLAGLITQRDQPPAVVAPEPTLAMPTLATVQPAPPIIAPALEEEVKVARLPRLRPDEPTTTGSVNPFAAELPLGASPTTGPAEAARAEDLRSRAFLIASSSAECDQVASSEVFKGGGLDAPIVVGIRCANGARYYLDRDAILSNQIAPPRPSRAALTGPEAISACEEKLRSGLAVPPSLSRLPASTGVNTTANGDAIVSFDFNAVNGLGFPVLMHVRCEIRQREIARLDVEPR